MTKEEAVEICSYVAQNLISPLAFDETPAKQVWEEMTGKPFSDFVGFINSMVKTN